MTCRCSVSLVTAVLLMAMIPAVAGDPELTVVRAEGLTRIDASFPAGLFSYAVPKKSDGTRTIYALAPTDSSFWENAEKEAPLPPCPEEGDSGPTLTLYRVDPAGDGRLVSLRSELPSSCELDAVDLDRDGAEELLLRCANAWHRLDPDGAGSLQQPIFEDARAISWVDSAGPPICGAVPGRLQLYSPDEESGRLQVASEIDLPLQGEVLADGIRIGSPVPQSIGRDRKSTALFATEPQRVGKRRLRTTLIEAPVDGEVKVTDCWVRLPSAEFVLEHAFLMLDGRPVLVVSTQMSDKMSLFGEKLLRVYPLRRDRSRLGASPLLEVRSRMNLWQMSTPHAIDVNADGVEDLIFGYWKGLKNDRIVLDVYLGLAEGGFENSPRTTSFDVADGDRTFHRYGTDLDGDGLADLLVRSGSSLLVFPGLPSSRGKKLVDTKPREIPFDHLPEASVTVEIGGKRGGAVMVGTGASAPELVDLNGDGLPEIIAANDSGSLPGSFHAIWLRP